MKKQVKKVVKTPVKKQSKPTAKGQVKKPAKKTVVKKNVKTAKAPVKTKKTTVKKSSTLSQTARKKENRDEFRMNKSSGHPTYIYAKMGNKYKYLGLTSSAITRGVKNIKLETNPEPKNKTTSYVRPVSKKAKTVKFKNKKLEGWKMSDKDKKKLKPLLK